VFYSSDDKKIVSSSWDKSIKIWDTKTGKNIRTFSSCTGYIRSVCQSSDGKRIIGGNYDNTIKIWDS
jgi:WD40 repeat protein